jgi:hypothetical protein
VKRRELLTGAAAVASVWPVRGLWAAAGVSTGYCAERYSKAIVIDALGGPGGLHPELPEGSPLPEGDVADMHRSGLTSLNLTVSEIGNAP